MKELEELLGRELTKMELVIFEMQKDNKDYYFEKDKNGNLISLKIIKEL